MSNVVSNATGIAEIREVSVPEVPAPMRLYIPVTPSGSGVLWLHGGGFTAGSYDDPEGDGVARALCADGSTVLTVEYRHADPDRAIYYPVPSDDVVAAWCWFVRSAPGLGLRRSLHLGGASAGGNLALGAAVRLRENGAFVPATLILAYPTLHSDQRDPDVELACLLERLPASERWSADLVRAMYRSYLGSWVGDPPLPAVPGLAGIDGLPPVFVLASEIDGLRVSAEDYVELLRAAGHPHEYVVEAGALHGHFNTPHVPQSGRSLQRLTEWVRRNNP